MLYIEHIALNVTDPIAMSEWYCKHFGLKVLHWVDAPVPVRFLGCPDTGLVVLELYANSKVPVQNFEELSQVSFHLAFATDDVAREYERILNQGASPLALVETLANGSIVAFFRDPWGIPVQFISRVTPLI